MASWVWGERERNEEQTPFATQIETSEIIFWYGKSVSHGLMATEEVTSVPWFQLDVIG